MLESKFQADLIAELRSLFPGCIILKNDSSYLPGVPDLLILFNDRWAALEVKKSANESKRPNQQYYVDSMMEMSYAAFIFPENKELIIDEIYSALQSRRTARISQRV